MADDAQPTVTLKIEGRVAQLSVDRPPLNILDLAALGELGEAARTIESRSEEVQVVLVHGGGDKAFSAGVAVEDHTPDKVPAMLELFHGALETLRRLPMPTVAAVHGHCLGGGMELAGACDIVVADAGARFGQPEIRLGCFPPYAAALFPRRIGHAATLELLASGRVIDADEAHRTGFVTVLAPAGELEGHVNRLIGSLAIWSAPVTRPPDTGRSARPTTAPSKKLLRRASASI